MYLEICVSNIWFEERRAATFSDVSWSIMRFFRADLRLSLWCRIMEQSLNRAFQSCSRQWLYSIFGVYLTKSGTTNFPHFSFRTPRPLDDIFPSLLPIEQNHPCLVRGPPQYSKANNFRNTTVLAQAPAMYQYCTPRTPGIFHVKSKWAYGSMLIPWLFQSCTLRWSKYLILICKE